MCTVGHCTVEKSLLEEALVEELRVCGGPLCLQAEQQVLEVDACDALPRGSGPRRPRTQRRPRSRALVWT